MVNRIERNMRKVSNVLSDGFFADRVVRSIRREGKVGKDQKEILNDVLKYIETANRGKELVTTGKLHDDAIKSIDAYNRLLSIIVRMDEKYREAFHTITSQIRTEINQSLEEKNIDREKLQITIQFFQILREITLQESGSAFVWEKPFLKKVEMVV